MKNISFENHDAYLLYEAVSEHFPDVHGEISLRYALWLYYKVHPEEKPATYKRYKTA